MIEFMIGFVLALAGILVSIVELVARFVTALLGGSSISAGGCLHWKQPTSLQPRLQPCWQRSLVRSWRLGTPLAQKSMMNF